MKVSVDFETRSPVDLKTRGAFVYFEHPSTKILMAAYHIEGDTPKIWTYDQPPPLDLFHAIRAGAGICAYNASFETLGFDMMAQRHGWPKPRYDQYVDTMAAAVALGLPRSLSNLGDALGLTVKKDKEGDRLIRKFSLPRRPHKDEPPGEYWNEPEDHVEDFEKFKRYCLQDIATEQEAARRLIPLSADERQTWLLNQTINRRGLRVDRESAAAAIRLVEKALALLNDELREVTNGAASTTQPGRLTAWVCEQGVEMTSAAKAEITALLGSDDLPSHVRRALEIRQEAAKTSTAKLKAFLNRSNADGRVRGAFLYHAASTGRESSTGVNFNNMPRPRKEYEDAHLDPAVLFKAFRSEDPDLLPALYGPKLGRPLHLVSDALRSFVFAAPGHHLVAADYSSIEGVVAAWLADEKWKLAAIREINANPELPDMYRRAAAAIVGSTTDIITKKHPLRQSVGKVSELALGYGGGVSAFVSMAANYGVDLDALYEPVWAAAPEANRNRAVKRYERCLVARDKVKTDMLSRNAWLACELIKIGWRQANPEIVKEWAEQGDAMRDAIRSPGVKMTAGKISYIVAHGYLFSRLPSGRCLAYGKPKMHDQVYAKVRLEDGTWPDEAGHMGRAEAEALAAKGLCKIEGAAKPAVTALGVNAVTQKYERFALYEGLNFENLVQATARDILVSGMRRAEESGYPIVLTVYDEIVAEVPANQGSAAELERLMCELPAWAAGMPVAADGWKNKRYHK